MQIPLAIRDPTRWLSPALPVLRRGKRLARRLYRDGKIAFLHGSAWPRTFTLYPAARIIHLDPMDQRARGELLSFGVKPYYKRNQSFTHCILRAFEPDLFIDVGANYGECTFSAPPGFRGEILAFEANPRLIPYLERSAKCNSDLRVQIVPAAVSDRDEEEIDFFVDREWSGSSAAIAPPDATHHRFDRLRVRTVTLNSMLPARVNPKCAFLKADVEGFEPRVLAGAQEIIKAFPDILCLVEFDTRFLQRAGLDPIAVLRTWSHMFDIFAIDEREDIVPVDRYMNGRAGKIYHTDLVLTKLASPVSNEKWRNALRHGNIRSWIEQSSAPR